ncbi:MAG TPA: ATP-binding protein, partial [Terracidiphilus sp.]
PIDDSAAPIRDGHGDIQGTVLVFRDVTERRRTERQLAEQASLLEKAAAQAQAQRQRLGLALTAGKMGVYEVNPADNVFWWSAEAYSLFGVDPEEFTPSRDSFANLVHPVNRAIFMQYWDENIAGFQPINREFRILKPDGKVRWISCRGTPAYDNSGSPVLYSGLFVDITERREAEQVLRKFERLSAAARLSAAIAHEINNPLGAVTNLLFLARETPGVPAAATDLLERAEQELERVAHAARQALGFYRESSSAELIDVPKLIDSVVKIYSAKIAEKNINIVRKFRKGPPVYAVYGEIRQVLSNLLANAIEAVKEGGTISLGAQPAASGDEPAIEITVADDGSGIPAEHLDHIFEPFFTTKAGTGTGLGLWVAKEIIERHQGRIEVRYTNPESEHRGAAFTVTLPGVPRTGASRLQSDSSGSIEKQ